MFIVMAVSLYISRLVLDALGVEDYGIYNVVKDEQSEKKFIQSLSPEMQEKHLDKLREKYPNIEDNSCVIHDTVYEVISRIKHTEYKRKGLPVVINRNLYL